MTIGLEKLRDRLLADSEVKAEYDRLGPVYEVVGALNDTQHKDRADESDGGELE
ncbi:hypothetical protein [Inquilinus sp. OTU3971]|uniref:hypothetical protein n=1 Tax=Inquilinus sp. OTU3971 TaxID=3043855 RepID=UPI00313CBAC4